MDVVKDAKIPWERQRDLRFHCTFIDGEWLLYQEIEFIL